MTAALEPNGTAGRQNLWPLLTAVTLTGIAHGLTDGLWVHQHMPEALFGTADLVLTTLVVTGLMITSSAALMTTATALYLILKRLTGHTGRAAATTGVLATAPLYVLNIHILEVAPALYWAGMGSASLGAAVLGKASATASGAGGWRRWVMAFLPVGALGCYLVNGTILQDLYRPQHASLTYLGLVLTLLWLSRAGWGQRHTSARVGKISLALGLVITLQALFILPDELGQRSRGALFHTTVETTHLIDLFASLSDTDGDGSAALLGGGDCDDDDPQTFPGAQDWPNDGADQDCVGGDATTEGRAALAARLHRASATSPKAPTHTPLIIISVDALRADRAASMAGYRALSTAGVRFEHAYASAPSTILSLTSALSGRAPGAITTERWVKWDLPISEGAETLPQALNRAGYDTKALFFHHLFEVRHGITRGFEDVWTVSDSERVIWGRSSKETTDRAIAFLDGRQEVGDTPYLLWVHYYDPHEPYVIHPELPPVDESDLIARYEAEVRWTDQHLVRLVERLRSGGELAKAVVVFTADHGESLGEHGRRFHGSALTEEQVQVPLVICAPGVRPGQVRSEPVSLLNLAATLLERLGLPPLAHSMGGSFAGLLDGPGNVAPVFTELKGHGHRQWAVLQWPWKLVYRPEAHHFSLFNIDRDPREMLDVYDLVPEVATNLETVLGEWTSQVQTTDAPPTHAP